jgi:hypothetical protein
LGNVVVLKLTIAVTVTAQTWPAGNSRGRTRQALVTTPLRRASSGDVSKSSPTSVDTAAGAGDPFGAGRSGVKAVEHRLRRWRMRDDESPQIERTERPTRRDQDESDGVPEGDQVIVEPTLDDEEMVPADQFEGDLDEDDSPGGQGITRPSDAEW